MPVSDDWPRAHKQIHRYVITNDGIPFRPEDWARLKKIAEGNPDESKIGAFGVGFYSLWSLAGRLTSSPRSMDTCSS